MKNKFFKISLITLGSLLGVAAISVGSVLIYSFNYKIPEQDVEIENKTSLVQAKGRSLYMMEMVINSD